MKVCSKCNIKKEFTEFGKGNDPTGLRYWCKSCEAERKKDYYHANKKDLRKKFKEYYQRQDKAKYAVKRALRRAAIKQATPAWANLQYIEDLYSNVAEANEVFSMIGIKFHVDHIIPLTHDLVCGLHTEHNLQVLTAEENLSKSNKYDPINTDIGV